MSPGTSVSPSSDQWKMQSTRSCCLGWVHKTVQITMLLKSTIRTCSLMHMYLFKWLQSKPVVRARCTIWDNVSFKEQNSLKVSIWKIIIRSIVRPFRPHWGGGVKWRPFRFRSPSWMTSFPVPETGMRSSNMATGREGPPFYASASIGVEKAAPSPGWRHFWRRHLRWCHPRWRRHK